MSAPVLQYSYSDITKKLEELPTLPTIVYELTRIINNPMSSTKEVEAVMENDIALTTRILKLANSSYYAIPGGCTSLGRAIAYLGFDTVSQLVTSASIVDAIKIEPSGEFNVTLFWKHSIGVAISAETIAKELGHPMPSDLFTAGLVHDMGKIALAVFNQDALSQISKFATTNNMSYFEAEAKLDLPRHTEVGRLLAEKWKLPLYLHSPIKYHHEINASLRSGISKEQNQVVDIVFLANLITHALKFGNSGHNKILGAPNELMGRLGMTAKDDFLKLAKNVKIQLDKGEEFVSNLLRQS